MTRSNVEVPYPYNDSPATLAELQAWREDVNKKLDVSVTDFGATGDGVTDDTQAIQDAIDWVYSQSYRGDVFLPRGKYLITDRIIVPENVNLVGSGSSQGGDLGSAGTQIIAGHADAQVCFGDPTTDTPTSGGVSGNFSMRGMEVSDREDGFLLCHSVVGRSFVGINVQNTVGDAVHIRIGQNCVFEQLDINACQGNGLTLDRGVGGHKFTRCEIATVRGYHLKFVETEHVAVTYPYNYHNNFDHCIFEYAYPYTAGNCSGVMLVEACGLGTFSNCVFALGSDATIDDGNAIIQVQPDFDTYPTILGEITLDNCYVTANGGASTLISQSGSSSRINLVGVNTFVGAGAGWDYTNGSMVRNGFMRWGSGISPRYTGSGVGSGLTPTNAAQFEAPLTVTVDDAAEVRSAIFYRKGESYARLEVTSTGALKWSNGSSSADTIFQRLGTNLAGTASGDKLIATAGLGVGNAASASTPGTCVKKMEVFDASGGSLGYVPIYSSIS